MLHDSSDEFLVACTSDAETVIARQVSSYDFDELALLPCCCCLIFHLQIAEIRVRERERDERQVHAFQACGMPICD